MKQLSFVDINYLIPEFKILENQRVDNFYYENEIFYIRVYVKGVGHKYLTNKVSQYIYLGDSKEDSSHPSSFIQYLRKYLRNSFIRTIEQIPNERIIKISFDQKIEEKIATFNLYLEIFANGNIILTDDQNIIKNALFKKKFKDRKVMVKDQYELPPKRDLSLHELNKGLLKQELNNSDLSLVKFLAIKFGIGGVYAEEVCSNIKVDKNIQANEFKELDLLYKELSQLLNKKKSNFNDEIKSYYMSNTQYETKDHKEKQFDLELKKLENRLKKQEAMQIEVINSSEEQSQIGNKIYENYTFIEELLTQINKAAKEKGWQHIEKTIKENKELNTKIKKLNYKINEIILNL